MIQIDDIEYVEASGKTQFRCTFNKSGYQIIFESSLPGDLNQQQITLEMQDEYQRWIERNDIP